MILLQRLGNLLLTMGAILGACTLLLIVLGPMAGVRPLLFRSDSMTPTIATGDLAFARVVPARALAVGDIVSVKTSGGDRVTHRIAGIEQHGDIARLILRGDANDGADPEPYEVTDADRVMFVVPKAGHVVDALTGPLGLFALGMGAAGVLTLAVRGGHGGGPVGPPSSATGGRRRTGRLAVATGSAMTVIMTAGPGSAAPWTDPVAVTGTTLTATTIPVTTLTCGGLGVLSVTFNWIAVPNATNYTLHFGPGGSSTVTTTNTSRTITTALAGGTAWVNVNRVFGSTTWTSANSNTRSYTVAVVSLCS